ncbi:hypothetical protein HJG60_011758 [Phyllostomus discolor]|uniref:Uncharacterized protein n=1 Tax=Phyllostomus discolor TaxID=89673 RepID=A0A834DYA5_9CHIR|nr:hypothetical protein HJG60_011758 [Phyllostomus discolor]
MPGLPAFIASTCAVLWASRPAASAPRPQATTPAGPSLDPARTTVGPSVHGRSCPSASSQVGPGLGCTGTRPCFSSADREINSPEGAEASATVSGQGGGRGQAVPLRSPGGKVGLPLPCPG